jgi:hypothetical protein
MLSAECPTFPFTSDRDCRMPQGSAWINISQLQLSEVNQTEVSRARVQQLIAKGEVLVNEDAGEGLAAAER